VAGGVRLNFSDRVGTTSLDLTSSYSPDHDVPASERLHARAVFRHWNWRITAALNPADFYDLFGPTKTSRTGYGFGLRYANSLIYDAPKRLGYSLDLAGYGGLKTLPEYQEVAAPYERLLLFNGNLSYEYLRRSLGALDDEMGTTWGLTARGTYANKTTYPRLSLDASRGLLLPLNHSSLWLRGSAGTALGRRRVDPLANFYFGGFGNNWVDHRAIRQFREPESFPGIDINAVGGANYTRLQLEWTTPPLRFRRAGIPSFYFRWADLSLFTTGLATDLDYDGLRHELVNVGAQVDVRVVTLSHLDSTLSFGFASAWSRGGSRSSSWMFSFKIM
jgi:hypothetical protein